MGAKWDKWKEEFAEEKRKQEEKDRIKAERKTNMSKKDKAVNDMISAGKWYAMFKWGIPALLVIGFVLLVLVTWVLNQFGIYLG